MVFVLACLAGAHVHAQPHPHMLIETEQGQHLLNEGRSQLINLQLSAADRTFYALAAQPGGTAAAHHHLSTARLLKALITDREEDFDAFFAHADTFAAVVDRLPASPWRTFFEGERHLHRALALVKTEHYIRAALAARRAFGAFKQVIAETPDFYEPYKGLGLLHMAIGATPGGYRRLLHFLGYEGQIEQGLRELEQAAQHSRYGQEEALLFRALVAITLNLDPEKGQQIMEQLHRAHPESPLIQYFYGFVLLSNRQADQAEALLRAARQQMREPGYLYIDYADFYLGDALFKQNEFRAAERMLRQYLARHPGPALKAMTSLQIGLALEMQDDREEALIFYRRINSTRDFDSDATARQWAQERLARPMSPVERQLLLGRNAYDAGDYARADSILQAVFHQSDVPLEARAEAAYRLGRVYHAQDRFDEALSAYQWAVDHPVDPDERWAPWSQYYIGEIYLEHDKLQPAEHAFRAALAYEGDYGYRYGLEQRARAALERVAARKG